MVFLEKLHNSETPLTVFSDTSDYLGRSQEKEGRSYVDDEPTRENEATKVSLRFRKLRNSKTKTSHIIPCHRCCHFSIENRNVLFLIFVFTGRCIVLKCKKSEEEPENSFQVGIWG